MKRFLTFDDIGIIPKYNKIKSRSNTNINITLGKDKYKIPFIPANMDSVISIELAKICRKYNAPIIFHRFSPLNEQIELFRQFREAYISLGVKDNNIETFQVLYNIGCKRFCIDIAHGHSESVINMIKNIKKIDSEIQIIAGNVCTYNGVKDLSDAGADIIKIGVGPGAACITRMMTGVGIPQFSAIQECYKAKTDILEKTGKNISLIADGGIKHPRDCVLAIAAGADGVMMGSVFARTIESGSFKTKVNNKTYGKYRGQASSDFMQEYFDDNKYRHPEGVSFEIEITKNASDVFNEYCGGLKSALTYCGVDNIDDFRNNVEIFETTSNYLIESNYRKE